MKVIHWSSKYQWEQWQANHKKLGLAALWPKSRANAPTMRCKTDEMVAWKRISEVAHSAVMCWCASAGGCERRPGYGEGRWSSGRSRTLITLVFLASAWNMFNMTRKICLRFKTENYWKSQSTIFPWFGHKTSQSMKIYARNVKLSGAVKSGVNFHIIFILCLDWSVRKGFLCE